HVAVHLRRARRVFDVARVRRARRGRDRSRATARRAVCRVSLQEAARSEAVANQRSESMSVAYSLPTRTSSSVPESGPLPNRWSGIVRPYSADDVERLRGSFHVEHTIAKLGAQRLWELLHTEEFVGALGAMTGNQAMQQVRAGLKAIYLSGWQVAADANLAGEMYPDQS